MKTLKIAKRGSTATEKTRQPLRGRNRNNQSSIPQRDATTDKTGQSPRSFNDKPRRAAGDRHARPSGDRPQRSFNDKPRYDNSDRPARPSGDRPQRSFNDKPRYDNSDRPARPSGDRPQRSFNDKPRYDNSDRPARPSGDRPQRSFNDKPRYDNSDRPARPSGDRPQRSFNDKPANPYGERPARTASDKPRRTSDERPSRTNNEAPANPYGDRPRRHMVQEPRRHGKVRDDIKPRSNADKSAPHAQVQSSDGIRLSKHLSDTGVCSRREADQYIERGWVTVNGQRAVLGQRILPTDRVQVAKQVAQAQESRVTILINKPVGIVSGQAEDGYEPAIALVTPDNQWVGDDSGRNFEHSHIRSLAPAGRLDIDSVGLLVLTQDGRVAKSLIGDKSDVDKEYLVRVEGSLSEEGLALLNHGLELDGMPLRPAQVVWQNQDQLRFVLREGKKRQIRRMCELVGLHVVGLKRIRIGQVLLGNLPEGQWRYLGENEVF